MSYARWSDGDVYVFGTMDDEFICMCCQFEPVRESKPTGLFEALGEVSMNDDFTCKSAQEMLEHLNKHVSSGDMVPAHALERLREEIDVSTTTP